MQLLRRLSAVLLSLALMAGNAAVCAGWAATPEERMACCEDGDCPMHKRESSDSDSGSVLTQLDADRCCASSERTESNPSAATPVGTISPPMLGSGIVLPVRIPALVLSDGWRTGSPVPTGPVARHVLLSVFLV